MRIISLAPSLTEDLYAIGAGRDMVGADVYSDRPAQAKALPRVGAMLGISVEKILSLAPTLVVGLPYQAPIIAQLKHEGIAAEIVGGDSLAQDYTTIQRIGVLSGKARQSNQFVFQLKQRIAVLHRKALRLPTRSGFAVVGTAPIYTSGRSSYLNELMRNANLLPLSDTVLQPWFSYSAEQLEISQPWILIIASHTQLPQTPPWSDLRAVQNGCIISVPDDDLFRPGPRVAAALERIIAQRAALPKACL